MPFPDQPRVKYQQNPLVEVICQWAFDDQTQKAVSTLDAAIAARIHDAIKDRFPLFNIAKRVGLEVNTQQQTVQQRDAEQYEFRSIDSSKKIDLNQNSVTLTTVVYDGWEVFRDDFLYFIDHGLNQAFGSLGVKRIGLRYKDVVQRSSVGLDKEPWNHLINPYLSNLHHEDNEMAVNIIGEQSQIVIALPNQEGRLNVTYGLVTNANSKELCFLIDSDFYYEGQLDDPTTREYMDRYNVKARNFFRWCISDSLHGALAPERI